MLHQRLSNDRLLLRRQVVSLMLQNDEAQRRSSVNAYFTTDVMGVDLGGVQRHGRAIAALSTAGRPALLRTNRACERRRRWWPSQAATSSSVNLQRSCSLLGCDTVTGFSQMLGLRFDSQEFVELRDAGAFGKLEVIADTRGTTLATT